MEDCACQSRLLAGLGEEILKESCSLFKTVKVKSGESVCLQGAECSRFVILVRVLVQLRRLTPDGRERTIRIVRRGDFFGDEGMLGYDEYSASAIALVDTVVALCQAKDSRKLILEHPQMALNYARCVRDHHNCEVANLEGPSSNRVRHRLLRLLCDLASEFGVAEPGGTTIDLGLTHYQLASLVGVERETITAALTALTRAGEISRRGRKILLPLRAIRAA
jgi:CRP/FNR family cyclic AMP-dependent transcriptional regulator